MLQDLLFEDKDANICEFNSCLLLAVRLAFDG